MNTDERAKQEGESAGSRLLGWIIALSLLGGSWAARKEAVALDELSENGVSIDARVDHVQTYHSGGRDGSWEYRAMLHFTTADGRPVSGETVIDRALFDSLAEAGSEIPETRRNQRVYLVEHETHLPIVYLPDDPERFKFRDPGNESDSAAIVSWIMALVGSCLACYMALSTIRAIRRRRAPD